MHFTIRNKIKKLSILKCCQTIFISSLPASVEENVWKVQWRNLGTRKPGKFPADFQSGSKGKDGGRASCVCSVCFAWCVISRLLGEDTDDATASTCNLAAHDMPCFRRRRFLSVAFGLFLIAVLAILISRKRIKVGDVRASLYFNFCQQQRLRKK